MDNRRDRDSSVMRVLAIVLVLNLAVAGAKLLFGYFASSVSMLADGLHSVMDGASNVVGLVGMSLARRGPDSGHPYGHRKFEALASIAISMFLFFTAYEVLREVIGRIHGAHEVKPTVQTFVVMGVTLVVNLFVTRYERGKSREYRSSILEADSHHTMSDVFVSMGVIVSLGAAVLNFPFLDIVTALMIVVLIAYAGYRIVSGAFTVLADSQVLEAGEVIGIAKGTPGVTHAHRVRSRGLPDDVHVDLHIHVPPKMSTETSHDLAHEVSRRISDHFPGVTDVVVHVEPEGHEEEPIHD